MGLDCYFTKRNDIFKDEDDLLYYRLNWSGVKKELEFSNKLGISSALSLSSLGCWEGDNGEHFLLKREGDFINVYKKEYDYNEDNEVINTTYQLNLCQKEDFSTFINILEDGLIKLKKYIYETSKIDFEEFIFTMNKNEFNSFIHKNDEYFNEYLYIAYFSFLIYSSILYSVKNKTDFYILYM